MKKKFFKSFFIIFLIPIVLFLVVCPNQDSLTNPRGPSYSSSSSSVSSQAVVERYGQLQIANTTTYGYTLCDESGDPVQLKGISSHGLQWYGNFMNEQSIQWLRDDWGATVVRAAMYTREEGYLNENGTIYNINMKNKVISIVNIAISLNMYVIIDWHILSDGNPQTYQTQAVTFFTEMANTFGSYPNVIYEICNEPNGAAVTWTGQIKPYAETLYSAIRAIDPDNIIIVGTSQWSQDVDTASLSPLNGTNIMYACHFYAGTHQSTLRSKIDTALSNGITVFISEWGTSDSSGNGGPYLTPNSDNWITYMNNKNISWCNWSLCDKNETSAALKQGASTTGGWNPSTNLTASGQYVRGKIRGN